MIRFEDVLPQRKDPTREKLEAIGEPPEDRVAYWPMTRWILRAVEVHDGIEDDAQQARYRLMTTRALERLEYIDRAHWECWLGTWSLHAESGEWGYGSKMALDWLG